MKTLLLILAVFCISPVSQNYRPPENLKVRVLPPGITVINSPIILRSGQSLIGNNSTLRLADKSNCPMIILGDESDFPASSENIYVSSITLDGNKDNQDSELWTGGHNRNNGVNIRNVKSALIENLTISNCRSGGLVVERGSREIVVINCKSTENFFDGFAAYDSTNCYFNNVEAAGNNYAGFSTDNNFHNNVVSNSQFSNNGREGIFMRQSRENLFQNCVIEGSPIGIFLARSELPDSAAERNLFVGCEFGGNLENFVERDGVVNFVVDAVYRGESLVFRK